jgi:hypothetical protein
MTIDAAGLSAAAILAIPADEPERLFPKDADALKKSFRKLAMRWHPDRCTEGSAAAVFAHLELLRGKGEEKLAEGTWQTPGLLELTATNGKAYEIRYGQRSTFELGTQYTSTAQVVYVVDKAYADLFKNGVAAIKGLKFAHDGMRKEMARNLPVIKAEIETKDAHVLVLEKAPDMIRLRDLLEQTGGAMDPKHVAWTLSNLYNVACYLRFNQLTHNDLSLDTVFVSPEHHGGTVLGGWWYATACKSKLKALPTRSVERAPSDVLRSHKADARVDLELIRAIGRELLGDPLGTRLSWSKEVPKAFATWLRAPASADALADYKAWHGHVLPGSFGPRRFVKWDKPLSNPYEPRRI